MDILDHNVEFVISSVKISFYTRESKVYPGGLFFYESHCNGEYGVNHGHENWKIAM